MVLKGQANPLAELPQTVPALHTANLMDYLPIRKAGNTLVTLADWHVFMGSGDYWLFTGSHARFLLDLS
ncbi:hypothetical protein EVAR_96169_1 [Eumeta japonica]|uniref:Uncharacterized protein n=1 Tax=Eumeta variegata TaxID=151549 RepID=A0A4C1VJU7_EUMVA|nr:hypothetical protein EVAR_96169_1 [Eumeta japonica]